MVRLTVVVCVRIPAFWATHRDLPAREGATCGAWANDVWLQSETSRLEKQRRIFTEIAPLSLCGKSDRADKVEGVERGFPTHVSCWK
jgi:hypothetical protein